MTGEPHPSTAGRSSPPGADEPPAHREPRAGFVALIGRPNAGKSTLLNALIGVRLAAVTHKAQTTRHRIPGFLTDDETATQIVFVDTPGLLDPAYPLQEAMMRTARSAIEGVDVVAFLVDHDQPSPAERTLLVELAAADPEVLLVLTKIDQVPEAKLAAREATWREVVEWDGIHRLSAVTGDGLDALLTAVRERLPRQPYFYPEDDLTDLNLRFIAAELVREACYEELGKEVPYSVHVNVDEWTEPREPGEKTAIRATIYVERESQKGIVIGEGGRKLKAIGTRARRSIEALLESAVYLSLWVKVRKKWSRREADLRHFGYKR
ncbi:MAG: GTPase Era [Gemmatimonadetes bacterium]|nr:GTPase Era [Gemmatimonadota bacterium]